MVDGLHRDFWFADSGHRHGAGTAMDQSKTAFHIRPGHIYDQMIDRGIP